MASFVYNKAKYNMMTGAIDLSSDTIKIALMGAAHSASTKSDNTWADVSANEVSGTGYTSGGATMSGTTVTQGDVTYWDASDVSWTTATFTAYYAVIYDTSVSDNLICSIDFGVPGGLTVIAGDFNLVWNVSGILTLA